MPKLVKQTLTNYIPGSPGVPANPGQPFLPAREVFETQLLCSYGVDEAQLLAQGWKKVFIPESGKYVYTPPVSGVIVGVPYTYNCREVTTRVAVPPQPYIPPTVAVPPTPAQVIVDNLLGWNCRAYSKRSITNFGQASFKIPSSVIGAVVGLNSTPAESGYSDIPFAFYLAKGLAVVMERGSIVYSYGAYDSDDIFTVERFNGFIRYKVNNVTIRTVANAPDPLFLDAALFSGGDYVGDAELVGYSGAIASFKALKVSGGIAKFGGNTVLSALRVTGRTGSRGLTSFSSMLLLGSDHPYGGGAALLPSLSVDGDGELIAPNFAIGTGVLTVFSMSASGITGEVGGGATVLKGLDMLASEGSYGEGSLSFQSMLLFADASEGNGNATIYTGAAISGSINVLSDLYITMNSTGTISGAISFEAFEDALMNSLGTATFSLATQQELSAYMLSVATGASISPLSEENQSVWVVNASTLGSTRYENYGFNSFAKIGELYYGAKSDGLYQLDGDTDEGDHVRAMMSFGKQTFGTSLQKGVLNCYIGLSSAGRMYLKVLVEGASYLYAARASDEALKVQRFDIGKGIRANYIEFELYNKDGDDFELDTIEFTPVELSRRI